MRTNVFVKTKNVKRFVGLMEDLKKLPPNIPKLALIYGDHGIGKTQTLLWWATKNDIKQEDIKLNTTMWIIDRIGNMWRLWMPQQDLNTQCLTDLFIAMMIRFGRAFTHRTVGGADAELLHYPITTCKRIIERSVLLLARYPRNWHLFLKSPGNINQLQFIQIP